MADKSKSENIIEQFAKEVIDFSSQYGVENGASYRAENLAGKPNIYPKYGDFAHACVFRTYGTWWQDCKFAMQPVHGGSPPDYVSQDYVDLALDRLVIIHSVELYETYNPGALIRVLAANHGPSPRPVNNRPLHWVTLWHSEQPDGGPERCEAKSRIFRPKLMKQPTFPSDLIRLEFNSTLCPYYTELDAVKVVGELVTPPGQKEFVDAQKNGFKKSKKRLFQAKRRNRTQVDSFDSFPSLIAVRRLPDTVNLLDDQDDEEAYEDEEDDMPEHEESGDVCDLVQCSRMLSIEAERETDNGPFDRLPAELWMKIFSYLDFSNLRRVAGVSRRFYEVSGNVILDMRELNLRAFWPNLSDAALRSLYSHCNPRLQRLDMSWCGNYNQITTSGFANFLAESASQLTSLSLASCKFLNSDCILHIANCCQNLRELDLGSCRSIESDGFRPLARLIRLERLNLYRCKIDTISLKSVLQMCQNLRHLNLGSCTEITNFNEVAGQIGCYSKSLQSIDLWRARSLSSAGLQHIAANCPLLEEVDLGWCSNLDSYTHCFTNLVKLCPRLRKLFLTANRSVRDTDLDAVSTHLCDLEQLDVLGTREVTYPAVNRLLTNCKRLRMLDLSFCAEITHASVRKWNQKFPSCSILMSYQDTIDAHNPNPSRPPVRVGPVVLDRGPPLQPQEQA